MKLVLIFLFLISASHSWGSSSLVEAWVTDCYVFGRHSFISEIQLVDNRQLTIFKLFEDKTCHGHVSTVTYAGTFSTGNFFGEGIEFDSLPTRVNFTVHLESVIEQYNDPNSSDGCGLKNWKLNVAQDVSGRYCRPFQMPSINKMIHDIYKTQANDIRFGGLPLNWDLADPNSRPQKLSEIIFHLVF